MRRGPTGFSSRASQSPDQTVDGYVDHVSMLYRTRQNDRAMQVIQEGVARLQQRPEAVHLLMIAVARQEGREDEVQGYLRTCQGLRQRRPHQGLPASRPAKAPPPPPGRPLPRLPTSLPFGLPHF